MSKVADYVTERVVKMLENNVVPWKQKWTMQVPRNYNSGRPYNGINALLLSFAPYNDSRFLTLNQVNAAGGKVKKGEKSWMVVFWSVRKKEVVKSDGSKEEKKVFILTYYNVFNVEQTEGWEPKPFVKNENEVIPSCESIIAGLREKPAIIGGNPAYVPSKDCLMMPDIGMFKTSEDYYSAFFHELIHWTGGKTRLNRIDSCNMKSESYAKEELTAEIGAAFLCNLTGISPKTEENAAGYLSFWLKQLKNDPQMIVSAAGRAQKAVDWILNADLKQAATDEETGETSPVELATA